MEFELVKRTYSYLVVYGITGLVILLLGIAFGIRTLQYDQGIGNEDIIMLFIIVILLVFALKVIPNLKLKKHEEIGRVKFSNDCISVINKESVNDYNIHSLEALSIKLVGYQGQHRIGDSKSLGQGTDYPDIRPMDGLGNRIRIGHQKSEIRLEFYIDTIADYAELKEIVKMWLNYNKGFKIRILR